LQKVGVVYSWYSREIKVGSKCGRGRGNVVTREGKEEELKSGEDWVKRHKE
jgi:hypothetical protein